MKKVWLPLAAVLVVCVFAAGWLFWQTSTRMAGGSVGEEGVGPTPLRVAWMTSWATTGQVVEALIHTDILTRTGARVTFLSFLFGPPINEAALAGGVDVTVVGDAPAISLLARSPDWSVVSRTIYFPYALMVRADVPAETVAGLRGRTIGVPFGSGPQPTLYRWLEEAGLVIGDTVQVINLSPNEMAEAIAAGRVDAIMAWEPTTTLMTDSNSARVLKAAVGVGFMLVKNNYLERYPDNVARFLEAWRQALLFTAQNRAETDQWFAVDSRMPTELLARLEVVDPNFAATTLEQIDIRLSDEDIARNQGKADFMHAQGLIAAPLNIRARLWDGVGAPSIAVSAQ